MSEERADPTALPAETAVGRVGVRVDAVERLAPFYREVIGCRVEREGSVARLSAADGRELLVFSEDPDAPPRPPAAAGLYHVAIRLPDRPALGDALVRIRESGARLDGASDHHASEALYLHDPAGNGLELYCDRPREDWPRGADGRVQLDTLPLDLGDLAAAGDASARDRLPAGTDVGHVHLEGTDLAASTAFYVEGLGFRQSAQDVPGALFLAAGDYHHHVAVNLWNRRRDPLGDHQGLRWFEVALPDAAARERVGERLTDRGLEARERDGLPAVEDPDGVEVRLAVRDARDGR